MKKYLILCLTIFFSQSLSAAIVCSTPRENKTIEISDSKVSIKGPEELGASRWVASVKGVRTKLVGTGFTKVLFHNGSKHIIHIEDKNEFSVLDDYLIIRSKEGHEIIYPLSCE